MRKLHAMALIVALIFITSWVFAAKVQPHSHAVAGGTHVATRISMMPYEIGG